MTDLETTETIEVTDMTETKETIEVIDMTETTETTETTEPIGETEDPEGIEKTGIEISTEGPETKVLDTRRDLDTREDLSQETESLSLSPRLTKSVLETTESTSSLRYIFISIQVISTEEVKGRTKTMMRCVLGDSTGIVNASFPDSEHLKSGNSIAIFGAEARVVKEHIEVQITNEGRVNKAKKEIGDVNDSLNVSAKSWVPVD